MIFVSAQTGSMAGKVQGGNGLFQHKLRER